MGIHVEALGPDFGLQPAGIFQQPGLQDRPVASTVALPPKRKKQRMASLPCQKNKPRTMRAQRLNPF